MIKKNIKLPQQGAHEHTPAQSASGLAATAIQSQPASDAAVCQYDLFDTPVPQRALVEDYLTPIQAAYVCPILGTLKKQYQERLCIALMDYMETGRPVIPGNFVLSALFMHLTRVGIPEYDDASDARIIRPFVSRK